jgi:hypothetical protein
LVSLAVKDKIPDGCDGFTRVTLNEVKALSFAHTASSPEPLMMVFDATTKIAYKMSMRFSADETPRYGTGTSDHGGSKV